MPNDPLTPEDYEREYADLDEKTILISILAELSAIRQTLTRPRATRDGDGDAGEGVTWSCMFCAHTVREDERERHLRREHDAPDGIDVGEVFEPV